jgi:hypothetical protein
MGITDSIFSNNIAYEGGVIVLDQRGILVAKAITMTWNIAISSGGCMLARTNSWFKIENSFFKQNLAYGQSSVI